MSEQTFKIGDNVQHKTRQLSEAKVVKHGNGSRIGVSHNHLHPYGVEFVINWFSTKSLIKVGESSE